MPALVPQPWPAPQPLPSTRLAPQPQQQQPRQEQQRPSPEPAPAPQQPQQIQPPQERTQAQTPARPGTSWLSRGPPATSDAVAGANSWLFVPLLQATAGNLRRDASEQWEGHAFFGPVWRENLLHLHCAAPVHIQAILRAIEVHQAAAALDRRLTAAELTVAGVLQQASGSLPEQSSVFCAWAVEHCMLADGYIPAVAQEVLLLLFLGERGAARLVAAAGQYRAATAEPLAHADARRPSNPQASGTPMAAQQAAALQAPTVPDTQLVEHRDNSTGQAGAAPAAQTALPPGPPPNDASPDDILGGRSPAPAAEPSEPDEVDTAQPTRFLPLPGARLRAAFAAIDALDAETVLSHPCSSVRSPPHFLKGTLRKALRFALDLIHNADGHGGVGSERAWKLWLLLPRLLLFRPAGGAPVPKQDFLARFDAFFRGEWQLLVNVSGSFPDENQTGPAEAPPRSHSPRVPADDATRRAERAVRLARLGELS
ncbi:unnamed protein product, partial [Effrenium voratum]